MKTYLLSIVGGFALAAALWSGLFFLQLGGPTESSRWLHEIITLKNAAAERAQGGRRILIVAGSNALFGVSAELIEKELGVPTINLGIHGGVGIKYILYYAKQVARKGDIIIFPLEYSSYRSDGGFSDIYLDYVLARDINHFHSLTYNEQIRLMLSVSVLRLLRGLSATISMPKKDTSGYRSETVNAYGDETNNVKTATPERFKIDIASLVAQDWRGALHPERRAWSLLREFAMWCKANDILLLATFPGYVYFDEYQKAENKPLFDYIPKFYRSIDVPVLGDPFEFMFPRDDFFDTRYHMNDVGVRKRTEKLIPLIRPFISQGKLLSRSNIHH